MKLCRPRVVVILAMAAVAIVLLALVVAWWKRDRDINAARAHWQPKDALLPSMSVPPVPGWRSSVGDGMKIAASDEPGDSPAYIGHVDSHAYFIATSPGTPTPRWWLVGLDVKDGSRLFPPTELDTAANAPHCYLNGPTTIFCIRDDGDIRNAVSGSVAWVIDNGTGKVSHAGPTDLRTYPGQHLTVAQVGIYAVAHRQDEGVYGVGPLAETTWFVPGDGRIDDASQNLAVQTSAGRGSDRKILFSVADGRVITPELSPGAEQRKTEIFEGGFVAQTVVGNDAPKVEFFDFTGKRTSPRSIQGSLRSAGDLPVVEFPDDKWAVYTVDGEKLLEVSGENRGSLVIGEGLFFFEGDDARFPLWGQYDLETGAKGKTCDFVMDRYLGTDGSVGVFAVRNPKVGFIASARSLATCDTLWELPSQPGSFARLWRIGTALVQLSDDGTELMTLVPPS